jgi:DNA-binding CsgD family transcriptional regulator
MGSWNPPPLPARIAATRHLPLVGRQAELKTMEAIWADVERARRQLVFIGGEPGAGKTRLAAEVAGALHENDVTVLVGTLSAETGIAYQPFAEMLDHLFSATVPASLGELVGDDGSELHRLSPAVTRHRPDVNVHGAESGDVRRDLFDALSRFFRRLTADRPLALVLDDLHWAQLPTVALLEHLAESTTDTRLLLLATFRTTAPDRSDEIAGRLAELHRLEGVRRVDLGGLDTDAIAEYVRLRSGLSLKEARAPAALIRDRTGGNAFFLRELWADLERRGGVPALYAVQRVPASIGDALQARIGGLEEEERKIIELAAVLGDDFELATLVSASEADPATTMALVDSATALGLIESAEPQADQFSFVHSLTRQAVLDRMPPSRRMLLHARAAAALERMPLHAPIVPRLANHYLAAHVLGYHDKALRYSTEAGRLADASLAFEEAAVWYERAAALPECSASGRADLLLTAAADYVRAGQFARARTIFEQLATADDPGTRLVAALGFEDATWRPGLLGTRAAELLAAAIERSGLDPHDPRYVRASGSLGRALALAGETARARHVGDRAIELAREAGDDATLLHALTTSLWHGITPEVAEIQLARAVEASRMAREARDHEALGAAVNFRSTVSYLLGRREDLSKAIEDARRAAEATAQPYYRHVHSCLAHAAAFLSGDFAEAERWADETLAIRPFGDEMAEGPHGVQMFMITRETDGLQRFVSFLDGHESFSGRWLPGLLALYTDLGIEVGAQRALHQLLDRDLEGHTDEAQWPMELAFMVEAALALQDTDAVRRLRPLLAVYGGMNLVSGTMIATFGSADRLLGRVAAHLGDLSAARRHLDIALDMDRKMRSAVHVAETLTHQALLAATTGQLERARAIAQQARGLAEPIGQRRVLRALAAVAPSARPAGLSEREVDVLRLVAAGLSNREIGARLHISANTAANHVRSIFMKTGAANRTQAAMYAAQHDLR